MMKLGATKISYTQPTSLPSSPRADKSDKSAISSDMPKREAFSSPKDYAKAMEKHVRYDMNELYDRIKNLSPEEQTAIIDNSHEFRRFLGIHNPDSFKNIAKNKVNWLKQQISSSSRSSPRSSLRIKDVDAPTALLIAATRSNDPMRVRRAWNHLDQRLQSTKSGMAKDRAIAQLAQELGNFKSKETVEKGVLIVAKQQFGMRDGFTPFDRNGENCVISYPMGRISNDDLEKFIESLNRIKDRFKDLGDDDEFKKNMDTMLKNVSSLRDEKRNSPFL